MLLCPKCGKELQAYMTLCPYCGQDLKVTPAQSQPSTPQETVWQNHTLGSPKSHRLRNILIVILLVAVIVFFVGPVILYLLGGEGSTTPPTNNATALITYTTTAKYGNNTVTVFTIYLFNDSESLDAGYFDYEPFNVTAGAMNVTVSGNFSASGGTGNDIEVYIMNSTQYNSWYNDEQTSVYYDSGQVTASTISLSLPPGQSYYLIFDNSFSSISSKTVSGEITLTYFVKL